MRKKRRWLWVLLFIGVAVLLSALATGWNVVLIRDYRHILTLAKNLALPSLPPEVDEHSTNLVFKMALGTLGFLAALTLILLIFIKLLSEMRLNQLQSEFLATVSHELKTPIAAVELSSSLIRSGGLSENEVQRLWNSHQIELKRLKNEVETLLEAARWQSNTSFSEKNSIHLEPWISQSMDRWKVILGSGAVLQREGDPLELKVNLDLKSLNLIIDNLLSNSKKFSRDIPYVIIRTQRIASRYFFKKPRWQLQLIDHGWGFDPADSKKIFHRFFRSHHPIPYAIPGTGLGLYLARAASKAMGLSLKAESRGVGNGAIFTLNGPEQIS